MDTVYYPTKNPAPRFWPVGIL
uniref:Uncharacterized protein n=1 Tax=Romanomermis culicivorax TaxID=13658 RepID=A0A915L5A8_ROMCU